MARPLNKKYFGNRNTGVGGYEGVTAGVIEPPHNAGETASFYPAGDDGIGGEGVSGLGIITERGAYLERIPSITFSEPSLPGGVTATGYVSLVRAVTAVVNNRGTGYQIGDIVEIVGGTGTTAATFRVTKVRIVDVQLVEGASSDQFDGGENLVWDQLVDYHWTTPLIISNISSTGNPNYDISGWASWSYGVWDGGINYDPAPTGNITITGGGDGFNTRGTGDVSGGVGDSNGAGGTVVFTWGIEQVELVSGGNYTAVLDEASSLINNTVDAVGTNGTLDVFYGVYDITMIQKGSGYINAADAVPTFSETIDAAETQATATATLTQDTGSGTGYKQGNSNNQENAIIAYIWQDGERRIADIVEQTGSKRYICITNSNGPGSGKEDETVYGYLVDHNANAPYQIDIGATDANGNTYFVTKLQGHKALVKRRAQAGGATFTINGYIDNDASGGNGEGETLHIVSLAGAPETFDVMDGWNGATVTWTTTPAVGTNMSTVISGSATLGGQAGWPTVYVPGAHVYLGSISSLVEMTVTLPGDGPAEWLFNDGDRVEWRLSNDINFDQVTIDNA